MYAMVGTRPDIVHVVTVKWILRYLRGTFKVRLCFGNDKPNIERFTNADWGGHMNSRNSTSGYVFTFAGEILWQSKLQNCVALSTTETEYIAAVEAYENALDEEDY